MIEFGFISLVIALVTGFFMSHNEKTESIGATLFVSMFFLIIINIVMFHALESECQRENNVADCEVFVEWKPVEIDEADKKQLE